jgi:ankyrin repeat protein
VVQLIVDKCPQALLEKDASGGTPLHVAVADEETPFEIVRCLVDACPEAMLAKDEEGQLPLHIALWIRTTPLELVRCLIDACPQALQVENEEGELPLHVAAVYSSLETIRLVVEKRPESLLAKNKEGERPVDLAAYVISGAEQIFAQWDVAAESAADANATAALINAPLGSSNHSIGDDDKEEGEGSGSSTEVSKEYAEAFRGASGEADAASEDCSSPRPKRRC